jgi:hypothetical protein
LGHRSQGHHKGSGPSRHLGWPLRSLSQLSLKDLSPAHGLGSVTLRLVPLAVDLAKLQPPLLHLLVLGSHLLLGRRSLFLSRLHLCPRQHCSLRLQLIAERPKVLKLSKGSLERQGRPSRGTPTPPGYGYLTRHLPRRATHTRLSGSASRQASPSARNEEETRLHAQIPRCSGLDSHNEQTPILRVPLQTELWFHSHGYEQPPHQRACGTTNSRWRATAPQWRTPSSSSHPAWRPRPTRHVTSTPVTTCKKPHRHLRQCRAFSTVEPVPRLEAALRVTQRCQLSAMITSQSAVGGGAAVDMAKNGPTVMATTDERKQRSNHMQARAPS